MSRPSEQRVPKRNVPPAAKFFHRQHQCPATLNLCKEEHLPEGRVCKKTGTKAGATLPSLRFSSLHSLFPYSPPAPAFDCSSQDPYGPAGICFRFWQNAPTQKGGQMSAPSHILYHLPQLCGCFQIHPGSLRQLLGSGLPQIVPGLVLHQYLRRFFLPYALYAEYL